MVTQRGTALNVLVSIIIELIRKNNSDYDQVNLLNTTIKDNVPSDRDPIYLGYMLRTFTENLPRLFSIVTDVDTDETILARENQLGEYFQTVGLETVQSCGTHCGTVALFEYGPHEF